MKKKDWRRLFGYLVHPAADVFPMLDGLELEVLATDIKAHGILEPPSYYERESDGERVLLDGRNRLAAAERADLGKPSELPATCVAYEREDGTFDRPFNPATFVISKNARRRHQSKTELAECITRAHKVVAGSSRQVGEMTKRHVEGKRGSEKDTVKAAIIADAEAHGVSKRTAERAIAKVDGKQPKSKKIRRCFVTSTGPAESPPLAPVTTVAGTGPAELPVTEPAAAVREWQRELRAKAAEVHSLVEFPDWQTFPCTPAT